MKESSTKICLIDDNIGDYRLVCEMLENGNSKKYSIAHFRNLSEGIENLSEKQFDVLLLDLFLPDSSGLGTFNSIKNCDIDIPVIVLTGMEDETLARKALQAGAQDYLVKGEFEQKLISRSIDYAIERFQLNQRLHQMSITDELTGLYNRRGFTTLAEQQLKSARRTNTKVLVLFIDVDGLKRINDQFGHRVGDSTLIATAEILRNTFRAADILARIGGDEFAVMAVASDDENGDVILERLNRRRNKFLSKVDEPYHLSISVGISEWIPEKPVSLEVLMSEADKAMYAQKRQKNEGPTLPDDDPQFGFDPEALDLTAIRENWDESQQSTILLVEDNPADARLVQEFLLEYPVDFQIVHADRVSEARDVLKDIQINLILLDLSLPDSHGLQSIDIMIAAAPNVPIVVMTGLDDHEAASQALQKGAQDFLTKGKFDADLLGRSIQHALERHRLNLQNTLMARELKLSEARFRRISDENLDGILILDAEQRVLFCNPAAETLFEASTGKRLLGEKVDLPVGIQDAHRITLAGEDAAPVHLDIRQTKIPWQGSTAYLTSVRDVSSLVLAQEAISRQAEDLGLINTINDALNHGVDLNQVVKVLQDGTCRVLSAYTATIYLLDTNREFLKPVNLDRSIGILKRSTDLTDKAIANLRIPIPPESVVHEILASEDPVLISDRDQMMRWSTDFIQSPDLPTAFRERATRLLPKIITMSGIKSVIVTPLVAEGETLGLLDITSKKKFSRTDLWRVATIAKQISMAISRKITEEQMRLQSAALDAAANAILITDRQGIINWANPAFTNLTGYELDEVIGKSPGILKSGRHSHDFYKQLWDTILDGRVWFGEMVNKRKNGDLYYEDMTVAPLTDASGQISHFIAIKQDITARKSAESVLQRQLDELAILHSVAVVCVEENDEDTLLERVTDICSGTLYPQHFGVLLLDEEKRVLRNHASFRGLPPDFVEAQIDVADGVVGSVARSGKSRRIADVSQVPEYIIATEGMHSVLSVPLKVGERVLGVLHTEGKEHNAFTDDDERLLSTIAGQLATAIEKIRQQKAEREQRIRAEALSATTLALNSSLEFDQILDQILVNILRVVPYETASLMLNDNGNSAIIRHVGFAERGFAAAIDGLVLKINQNNNLQKMMETGEPVIIGDVSGDPDWSRAPHSAWIRSYLGVPIRREARTIGFLNLDHSQENFFTDSHAEALKALSHQLSIALENARLYAETEQRAVELSRLYNASGVLLASTSTDVYQSGQAIVDTIRSEFGQSNCSLLLIGDDNQHLERIAAAGPYAKSVSEGQKLQLYGPGIAPSAVREKRIVNVPDVSLRADYIPNWEEARSEMAVPLIAGEKVIGVIDLQSVQKNAFNQDDERIVAVFAERAALSLENTRLYQHQQRQLSFLEALHQIDLAITGSMNLNVTLDVIARQVKSQLAVDAISFLVLDPHAISMEAVVQRGFLMPTHRKLGLRIGEGLGGKAAQQRRTVHMNFNGDGWQDCVRGEIFSSEGFKSYYGIPLMSKGQVKGVLELFHRDEFEPDNQWLNFSETVATQAAIAIDNAQMFQDLERSNMELSLAYDTTLEGWAKALELRDHETEGHSRRVVEMAINLAKKLGFEKSDLVDIRRGALLHDIGKMGVPDHILQKDGPLDDDEWEIMRLHPVYAYEWLRTTSYLRSALDIPHYHHEKWDGSGYPEGLKGEEIPMAARIFAIIDVWDALRSDRPYRKAWSIEKTLAFIKEQKGQHFDPKVVDAFLEMIMENKHA